MRPGKAIFIVAALLVGACSSDRKGGADAGGGDAVAGAGGSNVGGAGGGVAGGSGAGGGGAGTTGGAGGVAGASTGGAGAAGTGGAAGGGGAGAAGTGGAAGRGGAGAAGTGGVAGRGGGGGAGGSAGGSGGAGGTSCTPTSCGPTEYCDLLFSTCALGGPGSCKPRPMDCITPEKKVCACNGQVYRAECDANGSGQGISVTGGCTPPSGTFACGPFFCTQGAEYCYGDIPGVPQGGQSYYQCRPLPAGCGATPTCACLSPNGVCGLNCTMSAAGDLTQTCPVF